MTLQQSPDLATADLAVPDVANLDGQLQRINRISSTWSLPPLPDSIKLDLLANPSLASAQDQGDFLWGLHDDLNRAVQPNTFLSTAASPATSTPELTSPQPQQVQQAVAGPQPAAPSDMMFLPADDTQNQLRKVWHGITGLPAPEVVTSSAVEDMKIRAIQKGLLPANTPIDGSWTPGLNSVNYELAKQDFQQRILGSRPGAQRTKNVMDLIAKWTAPSGLVTAATQLGFIPDFGKVAKDLGDGPVGWLKAAAGIGLPILNDVLLFTGVSEVVAFVRGAQLARTGLAGAGLTSRLVEGGSVLGRSVAAGEEAAQLGRFGFKAINAADVAAEVDRFKEAGLVARRLQQSSSRFSGLGDAMAGWRNQFAVMTAKKAIQQGMKLGAIGQLESTIVPDLNSVGFFGGGNQGERMENARTAVLANPATEIVSVVLAPRTMLKPGAVTGPIRTGANFLRDAVSKVPDDVRLSRTMFNSLRAYLTFQDPVALQRLESLTREKGPQAALVEYIGGGDKAKAGEIMTFLVSSAAMRHAAERKVAELGLSVTDGTAYEEALHLYQNKFANQLRIIDDINPDNTDDLVAYARQRSRADFEDIVNPDGREALKGAKQSRDKVYAKVLGDLLHEDPTLRSAAVADARAAIEHHNTTVRSATLQDLFSQDGLDDYLVTHMVDIWNRVSPDQWDDFVGAQRRLEELYARGDVAFVNPRTADGWDWRPSSVMDDIAQVNLRPEDLRPLKGKGLLDSFGGNVDPLRGHFTVMKTDSITRQQAAAIHAYGRTLLGRLESIRVSQDGLDEMWDGFGTRLLARAGGAEIDPSLPVPSGAVDAGKAAIADMADSALRRLVADLAPIGKVQGISRGALERYASTLRWVAKNGGDPASALDHIQKQVNALDRATFWAGSNLGISSALSFDDKLKALVGRVPFLAAEVQVPDELAASLANKGYKAVFGTDFLFPADLTGMNGPMRELTQGHMRRVSLGTFLDRHSMEQINLLREKKFRIEAAARLKRAGVSTVMRDVGDEASAVFGPEGADMHDIVRTLRDELRDIKIKAGEANEDALKEGFLTKFATSIRNSYVPFSMWDLHPNRVRNLFKPVYGEAGAEAIVNALQQSQHLGWEYQGLGAVESYLKANSWIKGALHTFSKTDTSQSLGQWNGFRRAGVGVLSGAMALAQGANPATALAVGGATAATGAGGLQGRAAAGAVAAGAAAAFGGGLEGAVSAGVSAAMTPSSANRLFNPRYAVGLLGARTVGGLAAAEGMDPVQASLLGIGAGVGIAKGSSLAADRALNLYADKGWKEYSRLGGELGRLRDRLRFALNPFFDMQRYTEAMVLNATADLPKGYNLPVNPSLGGLKGWGGFSKAEQQDWIDRFSRASSNWINLDSLEATQRYFTERGVMGFTPTRWMAGSFAHLVNQGMDERQAAELVRNLYTYGTKGRSGLELSANFVFFPFSFQKKYYGSLAKFASQDLGRVVLMHDALKAYDVLNDRYDLSKKFEDHLPLLRDLQKMNAIAYGMNIGELGGINRPILESVLASPASQFVDPVLNMFLPQAWHITPGTDSANMQRLAARLVPAYRDVSRLLEDTAAQGHVLFSGSHKVAAAEVSAAYSEWNAFRSEVDSFARARGLSYDQVMRKKQYGPLQQFVKQKRDQLNSKYPAWADARARSAVRSQERQQELADLLANPSTPAEVQAFQFADVLANLDARLQAEGVSIRSDPEAVPAQMYAGIRQLAIELAREGTGFEALYRRYWADRFGPIQTKVI